MNGKNIDINPLFCNALVQFVKITRLLFEKYAKEYDKKIKELEI